MATAHASLVARELWVFVQLKVAHTERLSVCHNVKVATLSVLLQTLPDVVEHHHELILQYGGV